MFSLHWRAWYAYNYQKCQIADLFARLLYVHIIPQYTFIVKSDSIYKSTTFQFQSNSASLCSVSETIQSESPKRKESVQLLDVEVVFMEKLSPRNDFFPSLLNAVAKSILNY